MWLKRAAPYPLVVILGILIQGLSGIGKGEPWDNPAYWLLGYPLLLLLSGLFAFRYPTKRLWLWGVLLYWPYLLLWALIHGPGNIWPIALVIGSIILLPLVIASFIGSWLVLRKKVAE